MTNGRENVMRGRTFHHRNGQHELELFERDCKIREQGKELSRLKAENERMRQALEAIRYGSLEANFKQIFQTPQEIAAEALSAGEEKK